MQSSRRKCFYKRSDNFKVILNQFFYGGKQFVPDNVMETIRDEIHDETNILYNYTTPITIPILEYNNNVHFEGIRLICGPHLAIISPSEARADLMAR